MSRWSTWSGSYACEPAEVHAPTHAGAVADLVRDAAARGLRVKAVGAGHSFTPIALTDGLLLDTAGLDDLVAVDHRTRRVTVGAGMRLHVLNAHLLSHGLALPNLGDIDRQSVAGAISTGTHGTGVRRHGIASAVRGLQLVTADGQVHDLRDGDPLLDAARISLGALGVLTAVTLQCVPAFLLHAYEGPAALDDVLDDLDAFATGHDHAELYWFPHTGRALVKTNDVAPVDAEPRPVGRVRGWVDDELLSNTVFGAMTGLVARAPRLAPRVAAVSSRALSAREYTDHSAAVFCSRRRVRFREMEYAVPREAAADVVRELRDWVDRHDVAVSFPVEVRFLAADDVWCSTAYGRETAYVAVHQHHRMPTGAYFEAAETILLAADGRPHWGKLHGLGHDELRKRHPRLDDLVAERDRLDPTGVFTNDHLDHLLGPPPGATPTSGH